MRRYEALYVGRGAVDDAQPLLQRRLQRHAAVHGLGGGGGGEGGGGRGGGGKGGGHPGMVRRKQREGDWGVGNVFAWGIHSSGVGARL